MRFIYEKQTENKELTLKDVEENQFFVCADGYLCQKVYECGYNTIADDEGGPSCSHLTCEADMPIKRLLPIVEKIEF
jgi:hypothetical protein